MKWNLNKDWYELMKDEFDKDYFKWLENYLSKAYKEKTIYPEQKDIFNALNLCPLDKVKVIILGQDPYHNGPAHGLAFSSLDTKTPASLVNIFKEIKSDLPGTEICSNNLESWANQGVLLLNTVLTVEEGNPNSHKDIGWKNFVNEIVRRVLNNTGPVAVVLWGKQAQEYEKLVVSNTHIILKSSHPSPLSASRGVFGCKHFSKINKFISENYGDKEIINFKTN